MTDREPVDDRPTRAEIFAGEITITGPVHRLVVTDTDGQPLHGGSLAHAPTTDPPAVKPYKGPTGERAQWWWYDPSQPQPPPSTN